MSCLAAPVKAETRAPPRPDVARLVHRYGPRLYALAYRLCHNHADAEDLVQETFLQAHRKLHTFEGRSDVGTWLYAVAIRIYRRKFRRVGHKRMPAFTDVSPLQEASIADLPMDGGSPLQHEMAAEMQHAAEDQIAAMPPAFRIPLVLKDVCELPIADVAAVLRIKPQTVKTRVHRARLMLRRALVGRLPRRPAPAPSYDRQVCLDLLAAKLEAMDQGRGFPVGQEVVCERCRAVFAELDLTQEACSGLAVGEMPEALKRAVMGRLRLALSSK